MKKSLIFAIIAGTIITCGAFADDPFLPHYGGGPVNQIPEMEDDGDKRTTSQPYVYNRIQEETQVKIPATNPSNTNYGERVVTYTNVSGGGVIGERQLFTGGTYDADNDSGKLITASALNSAFTTLPEKTTTKLECANPSDGCTLWTITDQTAYGINGDGITTTIDLASIMGMSMGNDYGCINNNGRGSYRAIEYGLMQDGIWVVDYGNGKRIRGKSQCSSQVGDNNNGTWTNPTISSTLPDASGLYCYCQLDGYTTNGDNWGNMTALSAPWVFDRDIDLLGLGDASDCAAHCASVCANDLWVDNANLLAFRAAVFGSVQ